MRVDVAFTPGEEGRAPTGIVIDVVRATSTICQALAAGYERVYCTAEIEDARRLRAALGRGVLGGERGNLRIPGFDLGNSPREYLQARDGPLILTTTNGTRAVLAAASRCERVLIASLLNLGAVVEAARAAEEDVLVLCAGVQGALALDDAYVAGRIARDLGWERTDAAEAAVRLAASFASAEEALRVSRSGRNLLQTAPELTEDLGFCARESALPVAPRLVGLRDGAAEVTL